MLRFLVKLMMALLMSFSLVFTPIQTTGDPTAEPPAIETIEPTEEEKEQETIPSETVPTETKPVVIEPTPTEPEPTEPPHEHSYTSSILSATCTEAGYTTYTCQCGDSYTDNHEGALGHNYKSTVIEATKQNVAIHNTLAPDVKIHIQTAIQISSQLCMLTYQTTILSSTIIMR